MALLSVLWPLIWRFLAVAALVAAAWWGWAHFVKNPYIAEGVRQEQVNTTREKLRADEAVAANEVLGTRFQELSAKVANANQALDELKKADDAALSAKNRMLALLAKRERELQDKVSALSAIAHGPPAVTLEESCAEADSILESLSASRPRSSP